MYLLWKPNSLILDFLFTWLFITIFPICYIHLIYTYTRYFFDLGNFKLVFNLYFNIAAIVVRCNQHVKTNKKVKKKYFVKWFICSEL